MGTLIYSSYIYFCLKPKINPTPIKIEFFKKMFKDYLKKYKDSC